MAYSVKKSTVATIVGLSTVMLLAGCSNDQRYKRQVSGDESYLQAAELQDLRAPAGMILPLQNGDYDVPHAAGNGAVGKQLDIRPPAQPLALINGARAQFSGNTGVLMMENSRSGSVWPQVVNVVQSYRFPIASQQDASQQLTTDWVEWNRADEDNQYRGRYQISVQQQGYQQALTVKLLQLQQAGNDVSSPTQIQRYTAQMLNDISTGLDKMETAAQDAAASRSASQIDVQSGADDTGLPNLILRAPFNVSWQRLPAALQRIGMDITDSNRSQGSMKVTYKAPGDSTWDEIGAKDPQLPNGDYTLQVGDLDNRSSLQFIDPKGHVLTQSQNDALVAVLQAALSK
ncbi:MAG: outer membrane protein assembly factor BamC [Mixta calida]|uniref:Outer membrane protein assembly factor BamC n=1 Tax=Mixta calida TaxID=665913 RepID=A0ABM6S3I4_9GAMM|nr:MULTISPECIES: outer membrane protein assembly factor BamC [Mixta]AIX72918.1 outer membrane protein assembly factor BamC [Pantoea sp. PSNIH2]POU50204.1 outer membrane protein assembly factor BamC [Pantoea sp. PSNIH5]POU69028.1 outer membrane protein assembly factor BamC [Pantoea sp. PSNIH4]POY68743.1 outer membrane protein assembly factor BamC [Pantoea sp. PSNIH3]AUY26151.1 outer membrane protein assembly factor BamC [Mixta calida]